MNDAPSYEELEYKVRLLEREAKWREQAEKALRQSEERLKILFEYSPDMYFLCDADGVLIDANRAAEKVTGYDKTSVIGKNIFSIGMIPPEQVPKAGVLLERIASKEPTEPEEFTILRKDGDRVDVELRAYPVKFGESSVVLTTARDITVQKQTLERLREKEELYRQIFETYSVPLVVFNGETGLIEEANPAATSLFGHELEAFLAMGVKDLVTSSDEIKIILEGYNDLSPQGETVTLRSFRHAAGRRFSARIHTRKLTFRDRTLIIVRIIRL